MDNRHDWLSQNLDFDLQNLCARLAGPVFQLLLSRIGLQSSDHVGPDYLLHLPQVTCSFPLGRHEGEKDLVL